MNKASRIMMMCGLALLLIVGVSVLCSGCTGFGGPRKSEKAKTAPVTAAGRNVIRSIEFRGNHAYKDTALQKKIGFETGAYLDQVLAETGCEIINDLYRKKGYPHATVIIDAAKVGLGNVIYIIDEGPRVRINSVKFQGNSGIKTGDLKKAVKTSTRRWVVRPAYYTEQMVAADVEKLERIYHSKGYLNSSVRATGESHITFIINEGPLYRVGDITLIGNTQFSSETLLSGFELEPGDAYSAQKADLHAKEILKLYRENGYVNSTVTQRHQFVLGGAGNIANVVFDVKEGRQFRIGRVDITGNETTQDKVIRHVLDEYGFTPGSLYNAHMAPNEPGGQMEKYIQRMTLAEQAIIMPIPVAGDPNRLDASVDIKEGLTGMWNPGVGVGSDSGVMGHLVFQQRNFDITDTPDSFGDFIRMKAFRGAGQTFRIALEPGTEVSQYSVSFTEPYFRDRPTSLDAVGSFYERGRESYDEERMKAYLGFEQRREGNWRRSIGFRAENVNISNLENEYEAVGVDEDDVAQGYRPGIPKEIKDVEGKNTLLGVRFGIGRDLIDDKFDPSEGYTFDTSYEQVGGDHNFGLLNGVVVQYRTLHRDLLDRKTILATKLRMGTTVGNAPVFEKFYAGGTGTYGIRGFKYRGVSTRGKGTTAGWDSTVRSYGTPLYNAPFEPPSGGFDAVPRIERDDPVGSDWIFLANTEVAVPIVGENLSWLFFVDSGLIDSGGIRASIGAGVEIKIPQWFGPVPMRFELAAPFMKEDEDDTQVFSFSVGGFLF